MTLQKMKWLHDGKIIKTVCAVNEIEHGGEFTLCGAAIPDTNMKRGDDFERIGDEYNGRLKNVTCQNCLRHIWFVKGFE
jgi:hypothetical protein